MKIHKCVCSNITFAELKSICSSKGIFELSELTDCIDVAKNCRLCIPYMREMLRTGETEFCKIIIEENEED